MLTTTTKVSFSGSSIVNGVEAEGYNASISTNNPESVSINSWINTSNSSVYRANREICQEDKSEFEDMVFAAQEEMLANSPKIDTENTEETD